MKTYYVSLKFYVNAQDEDIAANVAYDMHYYGKREASAKNYDATICEAVVDVEEM